MELENDHLLQIWNGSNIYQRIDFWIEYQLQIYQKKISAVPRLQGLIAFITSDSRTIKDAEYFQIFKVKKSEDFFLFLVLNGWNQKAGESWNFTLTSFFTNEWLINGF